MATLKVEVVYALSRRQDRVSVELSEGSNAADAVRASGLLERHPEIDRTTLNLGLFGVAVPPGRLLADGDRVEILRPLLVGPKEARRRRARERR